MIEVKIPSEIRAYKSKLIAGLSVRQAHCGLRYQRTREEHANS